MPISPLFTAFSENHCTSTLLEPMLGLPHSLKGTTTSQRKGGQPRVVGGAPFLTSHRAPLFFFFLPFSAQTQVRDRVFPISVEFSGRPETQGCVVRQEPRAYHQSAVWLFTKTRVEPPLSPPPPTPLITFTAELRRENPRQRARLEFPR